jgi:hypothetical protein
LEKGEMLQAVRELYGDHVCAARDVAMIRDIDWQMFSEVSIVHEYVEQTDVSNETQLSVYRHGSVLVNIAQSAPTGNKSTHERLWEASTVLADYLIESFPSMEGLCVVELGCGTALAGLVAAHLGHNVMCAGYGFDGMRKCYAIASLHHAFHSCA